MIPPVEAGPVEKRLKAIDRGEVLARTPGAEGMAVGADFLVLDGRGQMLRGLNDTGATIWGLLDGRRSVEQIAAVLAERHGAPPDQVLPDVIAFLEQLQERGLVHSPRGAEESL